MELPEELLTWIGDVAGGRVAHADRIPGGGRKEGWLVDVERVGAGGVAELFLRFDRSDPASTKDPWTVHREARFYRALQGREVPLADVLGVHPHLQAMLMTRMTGASWFSRIEDPAEQEATARDFMAKLAALHRIDAGSLDVPSLTVPATVRDAVIQELDELDAVLDARGGDPDPALGFTLAWLRRNIPSYDGRVVLVQGDTGPGNFMYAEGRVVAVVDWELAHFGDPMDDIAWLSLRATQEPFTHFPSRLREYEELSGHRIDDARVRYYQLMAEAKLQVMGHRAGAGSATDASAADLGLDVGNRLIYGCLHRRLWLEALTAAMGIERSQPEPPPPAERKDHAWMYDALLDQLQKVVPRIEDPLAKTRSKGFARIIKYLATADAHATFYESCEIDDLTRLLGERPASLEAGRAALSAAARGGAMDEEYVRYLWRRVARETELARSAMGALADRHWPDLR